MEYEWEAQEWFDQDDTTGMNRMYYSESNWSFSLSYVVISQNEIYIQSMHCETKWHAC